MRTLRAALLAVVGIGSILAVGTLAPRAQASGDYRFSISDVTVTEGGGSAVFSISVTPAPTGTDSVSVTAQTANGTATSVAGSCPASPTAGQDYVATGPTVFTFNVATPGPQSFTVPVCNDPTSEGTEFFTANLSGATSNSCAGTPCSVGVSDSSGQGTIQDDETTVSINNVSQAEGNAGTTNFVFTASVSQTLPAGCTVTVPFITSNGTANAGSDYQSASGTFVIAAPATVDTEIFSVFGDTTPEPDETFNVLLGTPTYSAGCPAGFGAAVADGVGVGTILNDDGNTSGSLSVNDVTTTEGNTATFTVMRGSACPAGTSVTVPFDTRNPANGQPTGSATEGIDYLHTSGTVVIGSGETSRNLIVNTLEDAFTESGETFGVFLGTPTGTCASTVSDGQGQGTIVDDDGGPPPPSGGVVVNAGKVTINEGNIGTRICPVPVTLSTTSTSGVTVRYQTQDGTATAGSDYFSRAGDLVFAPGEVSKTIDITVISDRVDEPRRREKFFVNLSNPSGATLGVAQGKCKIYEGRRG
jgi:hypothetical protein